MDDNEALLMAMGLNSLSPPSVLYHYTSASALLSIVQSGHIWASHIRFLNDTSEAEWMWQGAFNRMKARKQSATSPDEIASLSQLIELMGRRVPSTDFVASFSENSDDLSQWRAYCAVGAGFSIGFASAALQTQWICDPLGGEPSFVGGALKKITYLSEDDPLDFDKQLDMALTQIAPIMHGKEGFHGPMTRDQFFVAWLSGMASAYKHASFRDEREWRLIMSKPHKPMPGQRFRAGKSSIVPYVEVELNRDYKSQHAANYMIERVVVGPTPDSTLSIQALKNLFLSQGHPEVEIVPSKIPFRNW
jgi:hypothetical protein